jgi:hypothetical protein
MASDDPAGPGQGSTRPVPESCPADCRAHREHVYILCYGQPVIVKDRDYLLADPATDYPITHYVGYTRQQPPVKRIRSHAARSAHYIAQIRPGTLADEETAKRTETCPACGGSLWYFAESPTYPG